MTIIRPARLADVDAMKRTEDAAYTGSGYLQAESRAAIKSRVLAFPRGCLVAVSRGRVVGHCTAERRRRLTRFMLNYDARRRHWPAGRWLYVSDLAVGPEAQGTGIGTRLFLRQLALARRLGCRAALTAKPRLVRYYRRFGFEVAKTIRTGRGKVVYHVMTTPGAP